MIDVKLIAETNVPAAELISFAAKSCYQPQMPKMGELMDIENKLFKTGHHTTMQHNYFTFFIEGIAVSGITLGIHLVSPFYNTSQRSGRFCGGMFANPDYERIEKYIKFFWPEANIRQAMSFVKSGIEIYLDNFDSAVKIAEKFIRQERPRANDKFVKANSQKFAQEQLRVFVPTIFPTAGLFSVNLSALVAMYAAARNPVMKYVTQKMADIVLERYPRIDYMFKCGEKRRQNFLFNQSLDFWRDKSEIFCNPVMHSVKIDPDIDDIDYKVLSAEDLYPIDLSHFLLEFMDYSTVDIKAKIEISMATMGQDQRHRTIHRGRPHFSGNFYAPPIVAECGLMDKGSELMEYWHSLRLNREASFPLSLVESLAPYGAMIGYKKSIELNALIHEANKRLCWCAQEEIYHLSLALYRKIIEEKGEDYFLTKMFFPTCVTSGQCGEGDRYCGRDLTSDCFVERKV